MGSGAPLYYNQRMNVALLAEEMGVDIKPVAEPGKRVIETKW